MAAEVQPSNAENFRQENKRTEKKQKPSLCGATERIDALRPSPSNAALCTFYRLADQRRRIHASFQFGYRSLMFGLGALSPF